MTQAIATAKDGSKSNIQLKVYKPLKGQLQLLWINPLQSDEKVGLSTIFHTMLGQKGIDRPVDDEVRKVCDSVIEDVEKTLKTELKSLVPLTYRKQTVAGINYFINAIATAKDGTQMNIRFDVFRPLKGQPELVAYEL